MIGRQRSHVKTHVDLPYKYLELDTELSRRPPLLYSDTVAQTLAQARNYMAQ